MSWERVEAKGPEHAEYGPREVVDGLKSAIAFFESYEDGKSAHSRDAQGAIVEAMTALDTLLKQQRITEAALPEDWYRKLEAAQAEAFKGGGSGDRRREIIADLRAALAILEKAEESAERP